MHGLLILVHDVIYKKICLRMMGVVFFIGDYLRAFDSFTEFFIVDFKKITKAD